MSSEIWTGFPFDASRSSDSMILISLCSNLLPTSQLKHFKVCMTILVVQASDSTASIRMSATTAENLIHCLDCLEDILDQLGLKEHPKRVL